VLGGQPFAHVDLSSAKLEVDFIREHPHQRDSALITGLRTVHNCWVQNGIGVKTLSFIADNDRYFLPWSAPAADVNTFAGVVTIAVNH